MLSAIMRPFRKFYTNMVKAELNAYGLRYQDLLLEDPTVSEAIRRMPPSEKLARERRIKRAIDLSLKKTVLPAHLVPLQKPLEPYMTSSLAEVEAENAERDLLNG